MKKIFSSYLKNYFFTRNEMFQGEYKKILENNEIISNSNIYFVTKIKKIRFDKNISVGFNYNFKGNLLIGNCKIYFDYPLINFYFKIPFLREYFQTKFNLINNYYKSNIRIDFFNKLYMRYKFYKDFKINNDLSDSDGKNIFINSGLTQKLVYETDELIISSENFLGLLDSENLISPINIKGDIIYIGKSKEIVKRTSSHDKFSKFYSQLKDDEELLFYFLEFEDSNLCIEDYKLLNFNIISNFEVDEVVKENRISLIEASLINYFKPILNNQEKHKNLIKSEKVKKFLLKNGFTDIHIELITKGLLLKFGNNHIAHSNKHDIKFDLNSV